MQVLIWERACLEQRTTYSDQFLHPEPTPSFVLSQLLFHSFLHRSEHPVSSPHCAACAWSASRSAGMGLAAPRSLKSSAVSSGQCGRFLLHLLPREHWLVPAATSPSPLSIVTCKRLHDTTCHFLFQKQRQGAGPYQACAGPGTKAGFCRCR